MKMLLTLPLIFAFLTPSFVHAQTGDAPAKDAPAKLAGHSIHGEIFNEGPRQRAYLMGGTGKVHFPVTSKVAQVQEFFNQGVGQLHGFWFFEAERSFRHVAMLDPGCAMAYWGMAMANWENPTRAKGFLARAVELKKNAGRYEQMWIDGYADYLQGKGSDARQKKRNFIRSLEAIIQEFPDDVEAKAFLVVRLWQFKGELPISSHQAVDALLDQVFQANPLHPAHHYRIHLWDEEKRERGLGSAAKSGLSSPNIAHQWHMAAHIYSGLHRFADAAWEQEASARVDHSHMIHDRVLPDQIHNYAHAQEWLIRNLSHVGRANDAVALAKNLIELPHHPRFNVPEKKKGTGHYGRMRLFEVLERYELWHDVIALADTAYLEPTDDRQEQVKRLRLLGLAHANLGNRDKLHEVMAQLQNPQPDKKPATPEVTPAKEKEKVEKVEKDKKPAPVKKEVPNAQAAEALVELKAYDTLLQFKWDGLPSPSIKQQTEALEQFKKAKNIGQTRLARLYLKVDNKQAEDLARKAADSAKDEIQPLANLAYLLFECGKTKEAAETFERVRQISGHVDSLETPVFKRLEPLAKSLKLPADWRIPQAPAKDRGPCPPLDSLGPLYWHPAPAPSWKLTAENGPISSADFRGKPVIVIFYLGYGCLHCVQQLEKFGPRTKDFADAGISLLAISTDTADDLKKSLTQLKQGEKPAFPLISDAKLDVFKAYRVHDDFEQQPLHGTFLIDAQGLIRWQDISFEPFTDVAFLLKESQRLLRIPVSR